MGRDIKTTLTATGEGRTTARLNLTGSLPSLPAKKHVVAELHWRDL